MGCRSSGKGPRGRERRARTDLPRSSSKLASSGERQQQRPHRFRKAPGHGAQGETGRSCSRTEVSGERQGRWCNSSSGSTAAVHRFLFTLVRVCTRAESAVLGTTVAAPSLVSSIKIQGSCEWYVTLRSRARCLLAVPLLQREAVPARFFCQPSGGRGGGRALLGAHSSSLKSTYYAQLCMTLCEQNKLRAEREKSVYFFMNILFLVSPYFSSIFFCTQHAASFYTNTTYHKIRIEINITGHQIRSKANKKATSRLRLEGK